MSKRRRSNSTPEPTLPSFEPRLPRTEYDTPHRAGAQSIWAWEEYNSLKPDIEAILYFMNINKSQGYEIIKSDSVCTLSHRSEVNPRGRPPKLDSQKKDKIIELLDNKHDAQYITWQQLGIEVGVEATEKTIQVAMKEKEIIDGIALQKLLVSTMTAEKRVDRAENQLEAHGSAED
jgi:hypothetical protein